MYYTTFYNVNTIAIFLQVFNLTIFNSSQEAKGICWNFIFSICQSVESLNEFEAHKDD